MRKLLDEKLLEITVGGVLVALLVGALVGGWLGFVGAAMVTAGVFAGIAAFGTDLRFYERCGRFNMAATLFALVLFVVGAKEGAMGDVLFVGALVFGGLAMITFVIWLVAEIVIAPESTVCRCAIIIPASPPSGPDPIGIEPALVLLDAVGKAIGRASAEEAERKEREANARGQSLIERAYEMAYRSRCPRCSRYRHVA